MAQTQNFRSAINGFNRQDVVHYIEYINNRHSVEIERLNAQLQTAKEALEHAPKAPPADSTLQEKLDAANKKCAQLEQTVAQLQEKLNAQSVPTREPVAAELEAYRRAERAERQAQERAKQISAQANAALAEAALQAEETAGRIGQLADQACAQLQQYQQELQNSKAAFANAAAGLYAIGAEE